jgi:hypothetical protein
MESSKIEIDRDEINVHRSASVILDVIRDFIPNACFKEAYFELCEALAKGGMELSSKQVRKEYEAWKNLSGPSGHSSKRE